MLLRMERKIVRRIYGGIREGDSIRRRTNPEIEEILQKENIVRFIKSQRLRWYGHIRRDDQVREMPYTK